KPDNASYTFQYHAARIDALVSAEQISSLDLVVQDVGGAAALLWAVDNVPKLRSLTILSTPTWPSLTFNDRLLVPLLKRPVAHRMWETKKNFKELLRRAAPRATLSEQVVTRYWEPFPENPSLLWKTLARPLAAAPVELKGLMERLGHLTI